MAPIFGYWDIRGLAAPIRFLLEYVGVEYEDKLYKCGPPPTFDRSDWVKDKFELGLDFPNLPYYIEGDVKLTQSATILHYLAKKHGLVGKTEADNLRLDLAEQQIYDYRMDFGRICYNPSFSELKNDYLKALPDKLQLLSKFLGDRKFVVGDYITYVDFLLLEYLEVQTHFNKDALKDFPVLESYHKRILELEPIDKYFKSSKFIKFPFNGAPAFFAGQYSDQLLKE